MARARIAELQATQRTLAELARRAAGTDPADCTGICAIIASR